MLSGPTCEALDCFVYALAAKSAVAIVPARRHTELGSRVALRAVVPTVIRSAWLNGY
jgi:phage terminase large subunit GpA-like protein